MTPGLENNTTSASRDDHEHPARTTPRRLTTTTRRRSRRRGNRRIDNNNNCDLCCCSCALYGHALFGRLFRILVRNNVYCLQRLVRALRSAVRWRRGGHARTRSRWHRRGVAHRAWTTAAANPGGRRCVCVCVCVCAADGCHIVPDNACNNKCAPALALALDARRPQHAHVRWAAALALSAVFR